MPAVYQSLASIARMPPPGVTPNKTALQTVSNTSSPSATPTETAPAANKPKLTLTVLTDYLAQLETTPITPQSGLQEPSSTTAECGEGLGPDANTLSAAARADMIFKRWIAAGMPDDVSKADLEEKKEATTDSVDNVATPKAEDKHGLPSPEEAKSLAEAEELNNKLLHERVTKFLQTIGQPPTRFERADRLAKENKSLQKQIASLQRTAQVSIKEKHNLSTQVVSLKQQHQARQLHLENELLKQKTAHEAKVKELEEQLAKQKKEYEHQLAQQKADFEQQLAKQKEEHSKEVSVHKDSITQLTRRSPSPTPSTRTNTALSILPSTKPRLTLTPTDISSWFTNRSASWHSWSSAYAHTNPNRLVELHPLQRDEVARGVSHFVRLTPDNKLPKQLIAYTSDPNNERIRCLLYGMLANFIVDECFRSPWWVFKALNKRGEDVLESPTVERVGTGGSKRDADEEPAGFRVDTATWDNHISPPILSPGVMVDLPAMPATARSISFMSPRLTNPGMVSMQSLGVIAAAMDGGCEPSVRPGMLPGEGEMEALFEMLGNVQTTPIASPSLRASLLHLLHEAGLSLDVTHPSLINNGDRRMLAECRKEYARKLKDKFLSGPARFVLRDQTPEGISVLEGKLVGEIDLALRFSGLVWGRADGEVQFKGLLDLPEYQESEEMEVYGGKTESERPSSINGEKSSSVMMVLQPAISCTTFSISASATAQSRSSSSASGPIRQSTSGRSSPETQAQPDVTTISKALILLSTSFSPSSSSATTTTTTPTNSSRPSTPQNSPPQEAIMTPDTVVCLRLSMAACPPTPAELSQEDLDNLETLPAASFKSGKRSPKLKLRKAPELKLGVSGWTKVEEGEKLMADS